MKTKFFLSLMVAMAMGMPGAVSAEQVPLFKYSKVDRVTVDQATVDNGNAYSVLDAKVVASVTKKQLTKPGFIEFMELDVPAESPMRTPDGFTRIAPVLEYTMRGPALKRGQEIALTVSYDSDIQFQKFVYYWSFKKQAWREVESVTDLKAKTVSFTMSLNSSRLLIVDTDVMVNGHASWYRFKKCMCAASPDYPRGSQLLVTNMNKGESIVVKVNDWGPERDLFPQRVIDLDVVAFEKLASRRVGVLTNIRVVPFHAEGFDPAVVDDLLSGKKVVIDEALIQPYIPQKNVQVTSAE